VQNQKIRRNLCSVLVLSSRFETAKNWERKEALDS